MRKLVLPLLCLAVVATAAAQGFNMSAIGVDTSRANIPVADILSGGPGPNGIPALGFAGDWQGAARPTQQPLFVTQEAASEWLAPQEPVIAFELGGEAKAYPLQILTWHEIANDVVGGRPVAVTFCPLCNSALAFDRVIPLTAAERDEVQALNPQAKFVELTPEFLAAYERQGNAVDDLVTGVEVTFGVSGMLFNSNLLMFDDSTSTLWAQILGEGNVGTLTGKKLLRYPAQIVSFAEFQETFPTATVLSRDTGFVRSYGRNPYVGYDSTDQPPFLFRNGDGSFKQVDGRLVAEERVVTFEFGEEAVAYPFSVLSQVRVVNDEVGGVPVVVMWKPGTTSALDQIDIAASRDIGAVGVFRRELDGRVLTFSWNGDEFVDDQTGSTWNLLGKATSGELAGSELEPVVHDNTLWFAWAAFKPETRVFAPN